MSFWDFVWLLVITYCFVAYLMLLFHVFGDLYRDPETGGFAKAMWTLFLIFLPFLGILVYLIARGKDMAGRTVTQAMQAREAQEAYIRDVAAAGSTPAEQVSQAKTLLDSGTISAEEFEAIKTKALA
jgi:Phospholipase_D-nuclease N-terminal